ncbi:hypothetical protein SAMN05216215_1012199 [Saccharopolyspora shandongensis]|uniref:DUF3800 domain-containing protein n=1 Tax=Saccharopolyspora shandongensis TaxID=418495 RepID=A0A1H3CYR8_9PSEU|nr:hypothetical protein [Saccharopolyspora shandongensis]SDX59275.1 hypothetical protein SAMN05216215_1012199 [Saccharopolyspora shandongensis]
MFVHAYVDESYDLTIGVYILTASIVDLDDAEEIRCALRELHTGNGKLHWHKSNPEHRRRFSKCLSTLPVRHLIVIGRGRLMSSERARRKCMEALLPSLEDMGVNIVMFEARQRVNDRHDINMVDACRRRKLISRLSVIFAPRDHELLLWLPDVACGTVLAAERGEASYLEQLGDSTQLAGIEIR